LVYVSISIENDLSCSHVTVIPLDKKDSVVSHCGPEVYFWIKDLSYYALSFAPMYCTFYVAKEGVEVTNSSQQQIFHANFSCLSDITLFWEYNRYSLNETKVPI
jgi:hypothetical protein